MTVSSAARTSDYSDPHPVAFVVATDHAPGSFHLDDDAFDHWFAAKGGLDDVDEVPDWLPDWIEDGAGAALTRLFGKADRAAVIVGDPEVTLHVCGDDDGETSGFYVILHNRSGAQTALGLTSGWQELLHLDDLAPRERARAYLEEICVIANFTLAKLQVVGGR